MVVEVEVAEEEGGGAAGTNVVEIIEGGLGVAAAVCGLEGEEFTDDA